MPRKKFPTPDEIDLTGISDPAIARIVVRRLLRGFRRGIPIIEERAGVLYRQRKDNRKALIGVARRGLDEEIFKAGIRGKKHTIGNLSVEANVIADAVLGALSEVYPQQLQ
jgi:hypothetical protein